jgi:DNA-directed RNA polymerase specialized sigma24 family protein
MDDVLTDLKTENNFAFGKLYKDNFYKISSFVKNNNGNEANAEDLFQDAMMVLLEKLRQDQFQLTASIDTYCFVILKKNEAS